jgi:hypothetical protein
MEVSGRLHASAILALGKERPVLIAQEAGWTPEPVLTLWRREKSLAHAGNRTPVVQTVTRCYTY